VFLLLVPLSPFPGNLPFGLPTSQAKGSTYILAPTASCALLIGERRLDDAALTEGAAPARILMDGAYGDRVVRGGKGVVVAVSVGLMN